MSIFDRLNIRGLLQDEEFLFGAGLLSAGSMGQSFGQAAFPAMLQAAKTANVFKEIGALRFDALFSEKLYFASLCFNISSCV